MAPDFHYLMSGPTGAHRHRIPSPGSSRTDRGSDREPPGPDSARQHPILIVVEDDPDDFLLLKRALWKAGATARVWWAHEAEEAIAMLQDFSSHGSPIGVVLDVQLRGLTGIELMHRIRSTKTGERVRIAFLTGSTDPKMRQRACEDGADAFFIKPFDPSEMVNVARELQALVLR